MTKTRSFSIRVVGLLAAAAIALAAVTLGAQTTPQTTKPLKIGSAAPSVN